MNSDCLTENTLLNIMHKYDSINRRYNKYLSSNVAWYENSFELQNDYLFVEARIARVKIMGILISSKNIDYIF